MSGRDVTHAEEALGRRLRRWGAGAVAFILVLAGLSYLLDLGPRVLGWHYPSPVTEPAEVAPPPGLTLPTPSVAGVVARAEPEGTANPAAVRRVVGRYIHDKDLGRSVAVAVDELSDGKTVYETGPTRVTPASTMKLLTTTAALAAMGPDHRFSTTVVAGASPRDVVLVGGGDPLLASSPQDDAYPVRADIVTLAKATAAALRKLGRTRVSLGYDTSLFTGPSVDPAWPASYVSQNVVSHISPLWLDEGRHEVLADRSGQPGRDTATVFAGLLERQGITVRGRPRSEKAAADSMEYASVSSAPLAQIVQWTLETSDNEAAEVLLRHVALAEGMPASFEGGVAALRKVLSRIGVDTSGDVMYDGSGLSRADRLSPKTLLSVLEAASSATHPKLRPVVANLPVAGFTGSLSHRFENGAREGLGLVRAKTGTLTGVHGLAGVLTDRDGTVLSFVAIADRVRPVHTLDARQRIDQLAAALAACSCGAS